MATEILCTLGPSSLNDRVIKRLEELNASLLRINLSHSSITDVAETIRYIKTQSSVPICLDTEGAQIRTGDSIKNPIVLTEHSFVKICRDYVIGNASKFNFYPINIVDQIEVDDFISIDFNEVLAHVVDKRFEDITLRIINGGKIGQNKAVTLHRSIHMPPLTEKDHKAISIGNEVLEIIYSLGDGK